MYINILRKFNHTLKLWSLILVLGVLMVMGSARVSQAADVTFDQEGEGFEVHLLYGKNADTGEMFVEESTQRVTVFYVAPAGDSLNEVFYLLPGESVSLTHCAGGNANRNFPDNLIVTLDCSVDTDVFHKASNGSWLDHIVDKQIVQLKFEALSANYFTQNGGESQEILAYSERSFEQVGNELYFRMVGGESTPPSPADEDDSSSIDVDNTDTIDPDLLGGEGGGLDPDKYQSDEDPASPWSGWTCSFHLNAGSSSSTHGLVLLGIFLALQLGFRLRKRA